MSKNNLNPSRSFQSLETNDLKSLVLNTNQINSYQGTTSIHNLYNKVTGKSLSYQTILLPTGKLGTQQTVLNADKTIDLTVPPVITSTLSGSQFSVQTNIDGLQFGDAFFLYKSNGVAELSSVLKSPNIAATYLGTETVGKGYTYVMVEGVPKIELRFNKTIMSQDLEVLGNIKAQTLTSEGFSFVDNNLEISGDLSVTGNFSVSGSVTNINTSNLIVDDNIIVLNNGETSNGVFEGSAGIQIDRGTAPDYMLIYKESVGAFTMGTIGNEKPLLLIDSVVVPHGITYWDETKGLLNTNTNALVYDQVNSNVISGSNFKVEYINEKVLNYGTKVNGVVLKNSNVSANNFEGNTLIVTDIYTTNIEINECTIRDELVVQDNIVTDRIKSYIPNNGILIDKTIVKNNTIILETLTSNTKLITNKIESIATSSGVIIDSILIKGDNIYGGNLEMEYAYFMDKIEVINDILSDNYTGTGTIVTENAIINDIIFTNNVRSLTNKINVNDVIIYNTNVLHSNTINYDTLIPNPVNTYKRNVVNVINYNIPLDAEYIGVNTLGSSKTLELPKISDCGLKHIYIQDENFNSQIFNIIINANSISGDTFKNPLNTSNTIAINGAMLELFNDGTSKWFEHMF